MHTDKHREHGIFTGENRSWSALIMSLLIKVLLPLFLFFSPLRIFSSILNSTFPLSSFKIGNRTIKKWNPHHAVQLKVLFVEYLMVIATASSYIYNPFSKDSEFWQGAKKVQFLVQSAFIQGCAIYPWAIKEFWNVYQVSCHGTCCCHHLLSPRKAVGNMTTLRKSGQVYLVFSLRLLVKETMGVLDTKTLRSCLSLFSTW